MERYKKLKLSLLSLVLAVAVALSAAAVALMSRVVGVYADDRYVELDGNSVFYTSIRGAEIDSTNADNNSADVEHYTRFKIGEDETVSYRQNLAYSWLVGKKDSEDKYTGEYEKQRFSMELSFENLSFKRFIIKFQSQQYVYTKDEKSENYLVFTPTDNGEKFDIIVATSLGDEEKGEELKGEKVGIVYPKDEHIRITFGEYVNGDYPLFINNNEAKTFDGKNIFFKKVYEQFASYVASGDNAVTPLTFSAEFEENAEADATANMILYSINGQSFEMHHNNSVWKVKDTAAPVMCFTETPSYLQYGKTISLNYKVIDVLASSPRSTAYYYILTGEQYASETFNYDKFDYTAESKDESAGEGENKEEESKEEKSPFIQVSSTANLTLVRDDKTFIPREYIGTDVYGLVKIYYEISDVSNTKTAQKEVVFVDWYAKDANKDVIDVYELKGDTNKSSYFLKLIGGKDGATYATEDNIIGSGKDDALEAYKQSVQAFEEAYQEKIDQAIAEMEDGKLYAGGEKFYLPALDYNFYDGYSTGRDYKYSIYYVAKTKGSHTSLEANKLAIDLSEADVRYTFTIYVTDTFGNPMRYPVTVENENGEKEIEWKEIKSGDIWEEENADLLPFFEFDVSYKEATAENPKNLSLPYVGSSYSGVSFNIKGVSGTYTSNYSLYVFDRNAFYKDLQTKFNGNSAVKVEPINYTAFKENLEKLFDNEYEYEGTKIENTRQYFTVVKEVANLLESDYNYEESKALNWNASSTSFTPQSVDDFYVVKLTLTDNRSQKATPYYAAVAASVQTTSLKGESDWVQNNIPSIVLFSVAGVFLIAFIVLLIVKPKDKGDIDVVYSDIENKKDAKKKSK
ncbi:MAG: hypothetical protein K2N14_03240 [Clostridia bacterium]|nr:hypothetical protein [Clostridia bacterium]